MRDLNGNRAKVNLGNFDSFGDVVEYLGRPATMDELREFTYPKIVETYKNYRERLFLSQDDAIESLCYEFPFRDQIEEAVAQYGDDATRVKQAWKKYH